jgi:ribose transport system ATP-binding protein
LAVAHDLSTDDVPGGRSGHQAVQPTLAIEGVSKRFGEVHALSDVTVDFLPGQVHGLIGANGSGKSTLVKVMSGAELPSKGAISFADRREVHLGSPAEATELGVRVVHQEAPVINSLTVLESVAIFRGYERGRFGRIAWRRLRRDVADLLERMGVDVSVNELCANLGASDRAGLALAIAMGNLADAPHQAPIRLLIVDEATASIPDSESGKHLERLRKIADEGVAVVMVTHRMGELEITDDITVLRGGWVVYRQQRAPRPTVSQLVSEMIAGDRADVAATAKPQQHPVTALWKVAPPVKTGKLSPDPDSREDVLAMDDVSGEELNGVSLTAKPGEIVGFVGVRHAGVTELPKILSGAVRRTRGTIKVGETTIKRKADPADLIAAGLNAVPADRLREGGVPSLSVSENVVLPAVRQYWHKRTQKRRVVNGVIEAFDVRPPDAKTRLAELSGGNQQKVLLGKWLALRPAVLCLDDPTYGVDPAARETIFEAIRDAAERGVCVLFFSTEPEQLLRLCDRVLTIEGGLITRELSKDEITLQALTESHTK